MRFSFTSMCTFPNSTRALVFATLCVATFGRTAAAQSIPKVPADRGNDCENLPLCPGESLTDPELGPGFILDYKYIPPRFDGELEQLMATPPPKPKCDANGDCGCPELSPDKTCKPRVTECRFAPTKEEQTICGFTGEKCELIDIPVRFLSCAAAGGTCPATAAVTSATSCKTVISDCCVWNSAGQEPRKIIRKNGNRECKVATSTTKNLECNKYVVHEGRNGIAYLESQGDPCRQDPNRSSCLGKCNVASVTAADGCKLKDAALTGEVTSCVKKAVVSAPAPGSLEEVLSVFPVTTDDPAAVESATEFLLKDAIQEKVDCDSSTASEPSR